MITPEHSHDNIQASKIEKDLKRAVIILSVVLMLLALAFVFFVAYSTISSLRNTNSGSSNIISRLTGGLIGGTSQPGGSGEVTKESQNPESATQTDQDKKEIETLVRSFYNTMNKDYGELKRFESTNPEAADVDVRDGFFSTWLDKLMPELIQYFEPESLQSMEREQKKLQDCYAWGDQDGYTVKRVTVLSIPEFTKTKPSYDSEPFVSSYIYPNKQFGFEAFATAIVQGTREEIHIVVVRDPQNGTPIKITDVRTENVPKTREIAVGKKNNKWYLVLRPLLK